MAINYLTYPAAVSSSRRGFLTKRMNTQFLLLAFVIGVAVVTQAQPSDQPGGPPPEARQGPPQGGLDQGPTMMPPGGDQPGPGNESAAQRDSENSAQLSARKTDSRSASGPTVAVVPPKGNAGARGDKALHLNFRKVPLNQVLNYLSDAAGFIIILEAELKGTVDVWSNQALNKSEAVTLLNSVLSKNGYGVVQDGHFLTVINRSDAQRRDNPIITGNNPVNIPKDAQIVTQIIPVRSLNATQLLKDLASLIPTDTTLTANEAGNSLIMTDTQLNIHRVAEIIKALDSVSSSINSIRVFPLQYGDAKMIVTVIKELFPSPDTTSSGRGNQPGGGFAMFPGGFGGPNANNGTANNANASSQKTSARVLAVADETSNSVIVSAPDNILPIICDLVKSIDVNVNDIAELKVFRLLNADSTEMATLISSLFPDDTSSNNNNNNNRFGGGPFGGNNQQNQASSTSDRAKRKGKVQAVADVRTASVIVSADKSLMPGIAAIVKQLDSDAAKKQRIYTYALQNADVQDVQQVLNDLFQSNGSANSSSSQSALSTRSTTMQQQQTQSQSQQSTLGSSSSGGGNGGF